MKQEKRPQMVVASLYDINHIKAKNILSRYAELCTEYQVTPVDYSEFPKHTLSELTAFEGVLASINAKATYLPQSIHNATASIQDEGYYNVLTSHNLEKALKKETCDVTTQKNAALLRRAILEIIPPERNLERTGASLGK